MSDEAVISNQISKVPWQLQEAAWKPGQTGNPAGRPLNPVKALARENAVAAMQLMIDRMRDPDPAVSTPAIKDVLDRAWGKATPMASDADSEENEVIVTIRRFFQP